MKIYTSYFGNLSRLKKDGIIPIGIALWQPKWFNGINLKIVAPHGYMIKNDLTREEYIREYTEKVLKRLDINMFLSQLEISSMGKDVALLCYEKPGDFCHRHLLSKWITEKTGIEINEFGLNPVKEIKKEEKEQELPSLFD